MAKKNKVLHTNEYLLSAAVAAYVFLADKTNEGNASCRSHLDKRKVKDRLERVLKYYNLSEIEIDWHCLPTTADYDFKPAGP